jgi:hypothetical protein
MTDTPPSDESGLQSLSQLLAGLGSAAPQAQLDLAAAWSKAVPEAMRAVTRAIAIDEDGALTVWCNDGRWATEVAHSRDFLIESLNKTGLEQRITDLIVRIAPRDGI